MKKVKNFLFFIVLISSMLSCEGMKKETNQKNFEEIESTIDEINRLNDSLNKFALDSLPDFTFDENERNETIRKGSELTDEELKAYGFK
jgi:uncharacterized protein YwgA